MYRISEELTQTTIRHFIRASHTLQLRASHIYRKMLQLKNSLNFAGDLSLDAFRQNVREIVQRLEPYRRDKISMKILRMKSSPDFVYVYLSVIIHSIYG